MSTTLPSPDSRPDVIDPRIGWPNSSAPARPARAVAAQVDSVLLWYREHGRDLPWRADSRPWPVLVSEVMLQQTPVARVAPIWTAWLEHWPTPRALAEASPADVLTAWGRLGYPRRALRLHACAQAIVAEHDGEVPTSEEDLLSLPGIGTYTAAAVRAFAFRRRAVVVDVNVRRVLARWLGGLALPPPGVSAREWRLADAVTPLDDARAADWAAASMELGALVCRARSPLCESCPLLADCAWVAAGRPKDAHQDQRRPQGYAGTDREQRGIAMAVLRDHHEPAGQGWVPVAVVAARMDPERADRILADLVTDGLVQRDAHGTHVRLPRATTPVV